MHHAWLIFDIRDHIFGYLTKRDVLHFGLTSKLFCDEILDRLWETIESRTPFLHTVSFRKLVNLKTLESSDLDRLFFYSQKIRRIQIDPQSSPNDLKTGTTIEEIMEMHLSESVPLRSLRLEWNYIWNKIAVTRPMSDFMPNLRVIEISDLANDCLLPLVGISGSNLQSIYIGCICDSRDRDVVKRFLSQLQPMPKLEYLLVKEREKDNEHGDLASLVLRQSCPQHLHLVPGFNVEHFFEQRPAFSNYPISLNILESSSLTHLTIRLSANWQSQRIAQLNSHTKFLPNLTALWISVATHQTCHDMNSSCVSFFDLLDAPSLKLLQLRFELYTESEQLLEIIRGVQRNCVLDTLIYLELILDASEVYECNECNHNSLYPKLMEISMVRQFLDELLPFSHLEDLHLRLPLKLDESLETYFHERLTKSLETIKRITLGSCLGAAIFDPRWYSLGLGKKSREEVPLQSLATFCHMFKSLESLVMGFPFDIILTRAIPNHFCEQIRRLEIDSGEARPFFTSMAPKTEGNSIEHVAAQTFPRADVIVTRRGFRTYIEGVSNKDPKSYSDLWRQSPAGIERKVCKD